MAHDESELSTDEQEELDRFGLELQTYARTFGSTNVGVVGISEKWHMVTFWDDGTMMWLRFECEDELQTDVGVDHAAFEYWRRGLA